MTDVAPYDARSVANLILDYADEIGEGLTQLQLYKILYFAHGWYLSCEKTPLISQSFQAWKFGPVVGVVREAFKAFGDQIISGRAKRLDIYSGNMVETDPVKKIDDVEFVKKIVDFYHTYNGWELSDMTHEKDSPWDRVWNSEKPIGNLGLVLEEGNIMSYFSNLPKRFTMN